VCCPRAWLWCLRLHIQAESGRLQYLETRRLWHEDRMARRRQKRDRENLQEEEQQQQQQPPEATGGSVGESAVSSSSSAADLAASSAESFSVDRVLALKKRSSSTYSPPSSEGLSFFDFALRRQATGNLSSSISSLSSPISETGGGSGGVTGGGAGDSGSGGGASAGHTWGGGEGEGASGASLTSRGSFLAAAAAAVGAVAALAFSAAQTAAALAARIRSGGSSGHSGSSGDFLGGGGGGAVGAPERKPRFLHVILAKAQAGSSKGSDAADAVLGKSKEEGSGEAADAPPFSSEGEDRAERGGSDEEDEAFFVGEAVEVLPHFADPLHGWMAGAAVAALGPRGRPSKVTLPGGSSGGASNFARIRRAPAASHV